MNCVKCGKETRENNVFCEECLAEMEKYPIRPGTVVQIPSRREEPERKPARKAKEQTPEEQIASLKKTIRFLTICAAVFAVMLALTAGALGFLLARQAEPVAETRPQSRNYSTALHPTD